MASYISVKAQRANGVYDVVKVEEETKDGNLYLNYTNGEKVSMQPDGTVGRRPHDQYQSWEQFIKTPKGYVAKAHEEKYALVTV